LILTADVSRNSYGQGSKLLRWSRLSPLERGLSQDLKAMLGADGKVSASDGNVVDLENMTGEAPMG